MIRFLCLFIFVFIRTAIAAECPSGFVAAPEHTLPVADSCPAGYVAAGDVQPCPANTTCALTCPIGYLLRTETGVFAPLNPAPAPSPSLRISDGTTTCWAELVPGNAKNSINVMYQGQAYHTTH